MRGKRFSETSPHTQTLPVRAVDKSAYLWDLGVCLKWARSNPQRITQAVVAVCPS